MGMSDRFDWTGDKSIVVDHHQGLAVYENENGEIVIRQEGWNDEDSCVCVDPGSLAAVIKKLESFICVAGK